MLLGLNLIFKPLSVLADVLPILGTLVEMGTGIVAFIIALVLSILTIGIAWVAYRPVLGISLIVLAVVVFFGLKFLRKKERVQPAGAAA